MKKVTPIDDITFEVIDIENDFTYPR